MNFDKQISFLGKWGFAVIKFSLFLTTFNLIYIFLYLNGFLADNIHEIGTIILTAIILVPFIFSPSFLAIASCTRLFFRNEVTSFKVFITSYKKNYLLAVKHGIIYEGIFLTLYSAFWYYGKFGILGRLIPLGLLILATVLFLFVLSYSSDRLEKLFDYWKYSTVLLLSSPILLIFMVLILFYIIYFCQYNGALSLFVAPGICALTTMYFYIECSKQINKKQKTNI